MNNSEQLKQDTLVSESITEETPFGPIEKKAPQIQYKVLTPDDPELMKKLEAADVEITVKKPSETSQLYGILGSMLLPLLFNEVIKEAYFVMFR